MSVIFVVSHVRVWTARRVTHTGRATCPVALGARATLLRVPIRRACLIPHHSSGFSEKVPEGFESPAGGLVFYVFDTETPVTGH